MACLGFRSLATSSGEDVHARVLEVDAHCSRDGAVRATPAELVAVRTEPRHAAA